jgi:hypothetical protein
VSLLPEGAGAQAAARTSKDTSASIFFMSNLLGFDLVTNASMPKTRTGQGKTVASDFRTSVPADDERDTDFSRWPLFLITD